jgi:hypothetical protein
MTIVLTITMSFNAYSQIDSSGIYITANDYKNHKLSYAINYKTEKHKINNSLIFKSGIIKIKHQGRVYDLKKSEIYGYKNTNGKELRFIGEKEYTILNAGEPFLLYFYQQPLHSEKGINKYLLTYYFSTSPEAIPQLLTKENLKLAFPNNHKFHDELDAQFKSDDELFNYDDFHKMYKIIWIYKNYIK